MNQITDNTCRICGNSAGNATYRLLEMHVGLKEAFVYFQCSSCSCIQISQIPENMAVYYPENYYSFSPPKHLKNQFILRSTIMLKKSLVQFYSGHFSLPGALLSLFFENPFPWLDKRISRFDSRILDVGSGKGKLILSMYRSGFKYLTGLDPYNPEFLDYGDGVRVYNRDIFSFEGEYDLIMFHHSFEHMEHPLEILNKTHQLLSKKGCVVIRIPVADGYAWRKYREHWVQLDAPRHFFIHSVKSIQLLCDKTGFRLDKMIYDSSHLQFTGSEKYLKGIPFSSKEEIFSKGQIRKYKKEAVKLNLQNDGDAACFYLSKSG